MNAVVNTQPGIVGQLIQARVRRPLSAQFPYFNLSLPDQEVLSSQLPDYVLHLRDLKAEVGFTATNLPSTAAASGTTVTHSGHSLTTATHAGRWLQFRLGAVVQYRKFISNSDANTYLIDEPITISGAAVALLDDSAVSDLYAGSWSGSTFTFDDNAVNRSLLSSLHEDFLFSRRGAEWKMVVANASILDYEITAVDPVARSITTSVAPPAPPAEPVSIYTNRIANDSTKALHRRTEAAFLSTPGVWSVANLRVRDRFQGHRFYSGIGVASGSGGSVYGEVTDELPGLTAGERYAREIGVSNSQAISSLPKDDDTNGTPRTGQVSLPRNLSVYTYEYVGRVI